MCFKHKVQDLLDTQANNFGLAPNIMNQPLPSHGGAIVGSILEGEKLNLIMDVNQLIIPLSFVKK